MNVSMILLASGRGTRLGAEVPKAYVAVRGVPLVVRSLARLAAVAERREIVLAVHPDDRERHLAALEDALDEHGPLSVVDGGETRQESMRRAFAATRDDADVVLVHDAARPFFPVAAARRALERAAAVGAALLAVPAPDTLKQCSADGHVTATLARDGVWLAQTPQVIRRDRLVAALDHARATDFTGTDDVSLCEHAGQPVEVVPGSPWNTKITSPADLELAGYIAAWLDGTEPTA